MRAVIQRVNHASVRVDGAVVGSAGRGLLILVGITQSDTEADVQYLTEKCVNMRIFPAEGDDKGFERSALEVGGDILLVSQFTLYATTRKGRRPAFVAAAPAELAEPMFAKVVASFRGTGLKVEAGVFGAMMVVELENSGPATIILDTAERNLPRD